MTLEQIRYLRAEICDAFLTNDFLNEKKKVQKGKVIEKFCKDNSISQIEAITVMLAIIDEMLSACGKEIEFKQDKIDEENDLSTEEEEQDATQKFQDAFARKSIPHLIYAEHLKVILRGTRWGLFNPGAGLDRLTKEKDVIKDRLQQLVDAVLYLDVPLNLIKYWDELSSWMRIAYIKGATGAFNTFSGWFMKGASLPSPKELCIHYDGIANKLPLQLEKIKTEKKAEDQNKVAVEIQAKTQNEVTSTSVQEIVTPSSLSDPSEINKVAGEETHIIEIKEKLGTQQYLEIPSQQTIASSLAENLELHRALPSTYFNKRNSGIFSPIATPTPTTLQDEKIFPNETDNPDVRFNAFKTFVMLNELTKEQIEFILNAEQAIIRKFDAGYVNAPFLSHSYIPNYSFNIPLIGIKVGGRVNEEEVTKFLDAIKENNKKPNQEKEKSLESKRQDKARCLVEQLYVLWQSVNDQSDSTVKGKAEKFLDNWIILFRKTLSNHVINKCG